MAGGSGSNGNGQSGGALGAVRVRAALAKRDVKRMLRSPFPDGERPVIVHCAHHKAGTVWMLSVLTDLARHYGMRFQRYDSPAPRSEADVVFYGTQYFDRSAFTRPIRGSHLVRDPRDLVVSGYFYHLKTREEWVHEPREELDGMTYQEKLRSLDKHDGLLLEIRRLTNFGAFRAMAAWDYDQPDFYEMRYEDLLADQAAGFRALFEAYGFTPAAVERATARAVERSESSRSTGAQTGHVRSGRPGEWREHLEPDHLAAIDEVAGDLISRLGYPAA